MTSYEVVFWGKKDLKKCIFSGSGELKTSNKQLKS